ncbi:GPR1/FUN34/YaaH family transporter [Isoptericola jiangsuensis]|uniref:GPR1/FUN34/YaaH family transporter n=1 Tax=Isoptericola jiangsuensis TaxID=548579 RepID=UPI003AAC76C0
MDTSSDDRPGRSEQLRLTRIVLRPTGNPLPLGFMALAMGTVGFSSLQLGVVGTAEESTVALAVLVLTVPLQLFAAIVGFGARDPIAGTGMALVSGVWAMLAVATLTSPPGTSSPALGVLLVTAGIALLIPATAAHGKVLAAVVMVGSGVRFAVTGIAEITGSGGWETTAGILGVVLALLALYAALGFVLEEVDHPLQLPVLRRGDGLKPLRDDMEEQVTGIARAAGVRQQL